MKKPLSPHLIRLFALAIFFTVFSAVYLLLPEKRPTTPNVENRTNTVSKPQILPNLTTSTETISPTKELTKPISNQQTNTTTTSPNSLTATLKTSNSTYNLRLQPNTNLLQAMRQLSAMSDQPFIFSGKEYPTLGFFVEEINGQKNDPTKETYWVYYINGRSANIGISNYLIQQGDLIEWKYAKSQF